MAALRDIGLEVPPLDSTLFTDIQQELVRMLGGLLPPGTAVRQIPMDGLAAAVLADANKVAGPDVMTVSTCLEIAAPTKGATVQINRIIGQDGDILGLGPRPGQPLLTAQMDAVVSQAAGRRILIVEDGSFTGKTLKHVIAMLQERGGVVRGVVVGFAFPGALEELNGCGGEVSCVEATDSASLMDWMPDYDFLPFVPNCGRPLGVELGGQCHVFYTADHASHAAPYIAPFAPVEQWASIPEDEVRAFSLRCIEMAKDMFLAIARLSRRRIMVGDLMNSWSRVSIPYRIGQGDFPYLLHTPIEEVLMGYWNELAII